MKKYIFITLLLTTSYLNAQLSEDFIPKDAVTVFSINNISLLKKVSLDELIQYDFMAEVQSELFDGSTSGKNLKDSGIDFDQKLNVFYGQNQDFEVAGFSFGISDKLKLFSVFDDFERQETPVKGIELYSSYFNHLIIKGNIGMVLRVDPTYEKISVLTDSIWMARGYGYFYDGYDNSYDEQKIEVEEEESEEIFHEEEIFEEGEEGMEDTLSAEKLNDFDIMNKNYWEMRDSITNELQYKYFSQIMKEIYVDNVHLKNQDQKFAAQLLHDSDGIFYLDNSRNFHNARGLWYFQSIMPELYTDLKQLYTGNVMLGDIVLNENSVDIYFEANYGEALGKIYEKLNGTKFDKNVLKYVHQNSTGFFTYNINLKEGYNQAYDIIIPILSQEKDPRISSNVLMAELINEFVDVDAVFDTYKGSMFGSFNGIKKVKTKKIEFFYDEETFEYGEKEIESEEDMPIFTLGFSTNRSDIPEKVLKHFGRMTSRFRNMGTYWIVEDAIFNSVPLFIINKNDLLIFTNDEDLAKNHNNGYGNQSLKGEKAKAAKKSKFMYAYFDWGVALKNLPKEMFNTKQNEILDAMRGKSGVIELTSSKTTKEKTSFNVSYRFEGEYENSGKYLLDLVNSVYVLSK
ncbi:MAG: hypothetical protein V4622_03790 [Bacteroidota bacterium]